MKKSVFAFCGLSILLVGCSNLQGIHTPTPSPQPQAQPSEILSDLNEWNTEELDVFECPDRYPERVAAGPTGGWIMAHKRMLSDRGVYVQWNCENKAYEIAQEENLTPLCGC